MARPFFQRCIASGSRPVLSATPRVASRVSQRGIVGDASSLASSSSAPRAAFNTQILEGLPGFLEKEQFSTITEWQAGLWSRLQAEVRSESHLFISNRSSLPFCGLCFRILGPLGVMLM